MRKKVKKRRARGFGSHNVYGAKDGFVAARRNAAQRLRHNSTYRIRTQIHYTERDTMEFDAEVVLHIHTFHKHHQMSQPSRPKRRFESSNVEHVEKSTLIRQIKKLVRQVEGQGVAPHILPELRNYLEGSGIVSSGIGNGRKAYSGDSSEDDIITPPRQQRGPKRRRLPPGDSQDHDRTTHQGDKPSFQIQAMNPTAPDLKELRVPKITSDWVSIRTESEIAGKRELQHIVRLMTGKAVKSTPQPDQNYEILASFSRMGSSFKANRTSAARLHSYGGILCCFLCLCALEENDDRTQVNEYQNAYFIKTHGDEYLQRLRTATKWLIDTIANTSEDLEYLAWEILYFCEFPSMSWCFLY